MNNIKLNPGTPGNFKKEEKNQIEKLNEELKPLYIEYNKLNKTITKKVNRIKYLKENIDLEFMRAIPADDLKKITKKQWEWILYAGHDETKTQYDFQTLFIKPFRRNGFIPETNQVSLLISLYDLDIKEIFKIFKYLKKYLKPVTIEDRNKKETGICFAILYEDEFSTAYVHEDGSVNFYISRNSNVESFPNFKTFLQWLRQQPN